MLLPTADGKNIGAVGKGRDEVLSACEDRPPHLPIAGPQLAMIWSVFRRKLDMNYTYSKLRPQPSAQKLVSFLDVAEDDDIRGSIITLPAKADIDVPAPYDYQVEIVERLLAERHSGIVHLPTGSGKTRVALEFISKKSEMEPEAIFFWVSYPKTLLRQGMTRMAEFSGRLPKKMRFIWLPDDRPFQYEDGLMDDCRCFFMMRETLTKALRQASDGRVNEELTGVPAAIS